MKTEKIMQRTINNSVVRQNHLTSYFNLNDLIVAGNSYRRIQGLPVRPLERYFQLKETKEFMQELSLSEGIPVSELKSIKRGRFGGTYAHPLIAIDLAMWLSPKFKVLVLKWFYDNLTLWRDNSGDSYRKMMQALDSAGHIANPTYYSKVANQIALRCGVNPSKKDKWEQASPAQLKLRDDIQNNIAILADMSDDLMLIINKSTIKAKGGETV